MRLLRHGERLRMSDHCTRYPEGYLTYASLTLQPSIGWTDQVQYATCGLIHSFIRGTVGSYRMYVDFVPYLWTTRTHTMFHHPLVVHCCVSSFVQVRHIPTNRIMVLKMNKNATSVKSLREVELLKQLHHPNTLQ